MSDGSLMLFVVLAVVVLVVVLLARSKPVKNYFAASARASRPATRPGKGVLSASERRQVAAEIVVVTDAGGSHWVEGAAVAERHGVSVFDVHDEVMAILEDRDRREDLAASRVTREMLKRGPAPEYLGDGGARVQVRGLSHWAKPDDVDALEDDFFVLVREPSNDHDANAIAVFCDSRKLGYLSASRAAVYAPLLDEAGVARLRAIRAEGEGIYFRLPSLVRLRKLASKG